MATVSAKYRARNVWDALTFWDRLRYRKRRGLGMLPVLIIHQGEYVIKDWMVPVHNVGGEETLNAHYERFYDPKLEHQKIEEGWHVPTV